MTKWVLALGLIVLHWCSWPIGAQAEVLKVPEEFAKIQDAMLAARYGDTILVSPGQYEGPVDIKNGVILKSADGPEQTTIRAYRWWIVRLADADTLTALIGFTLTGARAADRAVYCSGGGSPRVVGNIIEKAWFGLSCEGSSPIARDNTVRFNKQGILCEKASPLLVGNHITRNNTGVTLKDSYARMTNNTVDHNGIGIQVEEYSEPTIGGSPEKANDICNNSRHNLANLAKVKEEAIRTLKPLLLRVEHNYWGSECPDKVKFLGDVDYTPWVDKEHGKTFTACP